MMNFIKQYSTILWFVGIVAVLYGAYALFFAQESEPVVAVTETAAVPDQELVALLFELKNIRLDNAIFEDPLFKSLNDFGRELVPEPLGRTNPFAPLGGESAVTVTKARTAP